ncbi:uncharacterized protein LOC131855614 isoform X1 [Achroia grisella]|uniref:uncharacterized protein LOC131855614 isoform X1 n=1 Tax=Achroia grisella TaxID=688607 RepID=UPI0027D2270F|nr:uncharacterized protein LOC131855614 isoform X1 [Achroia grisella]
MASRTVRKVKRNKGKDSNITNVSLEDSLLPAVEVTPPDKDMKIKILKKIAEQKNNSNINETETKSFPQNLTTNSKSVDKMADFSVNQLIAELSENSRASKGEIENIQRKLLHQANEILKVNAFANSQTLTEPRIIDTMQKYENKPVYGRIPVVVPRNPNAAPQMVVVTNHQERRFDVSRQNLTRPNMAVIPKADDARRADNQLNDTQLVPERLQEVSAQFPMDNTGAMINSDQGNMQRVASSSVDAGRGAFFYETGSAASRPAASARAAPTRGTVEAVPPYRMPPAPEAALPGAPAPSTPAALHTHSAKFPIEREVILSSGDKNSKVPILQEARKRGRLGAVAPDTPPKALSAWTHAENQQAGTSGDNYRQYHENYNYAMHQNQNQGAISRNVQGQYDSPKPPIPAKNYGQKPDTPNNSQLITVTVETGKDNTRDAPKSSKSVSKTYHTLKDMISSRFKSKESNESDKGNEQESGLNNSEERKRPEPEQVTPRDNSNRKMEQGIYGRPVPHNRPDMQYNHVIPNNNMAYPSPSPHRQLMQQQIVQQHMLLNQQARSQEMLASTPLARQSQALGADALYQHYGPPGRRSAMYQRDIDVRSMANFTSLKTGPQTQFDNSHSRPDLRSPQQLEREIIRQRGLVEGRRAASHPHLLDDPQPRAEVTTPQIHDRSRRNSHGNLLEASLNDSGPPKNICDERESDDGGFRSRLVAQGRSSFEERIRTSGRSIESHRQERLQENVYRRTPEIQKERRTPDSLRPKQKEETIVSSQVAERNDESASQKSADSVYNSATKAETYNPQPSSSRQTPSRIEDLKSHGKKGAGSGASSDYDKNGGQSSNVDSGRGSVAYSSGRRPEASLHDTSADSDAIGPSRTQPQPGTSQQPPGQAGENEWADLVECELRQILEPKLAGMRLDSSGSSDSSVTPPLPPLSPSSDMHKRNSLPGRASEYPEERRRGRDSPRWHSHKKHSSKRDNHYKKHLFGLDTTDMTSTTTRSLDLSSLLDGRTDSDASTGDARAIRRQLRGLENMYAEVLQLLGVRKPASLAKQPTWESRLSSKRRYGSMSSLPSSSVSSRPVRDKRRSSNDHRKKHDLKGINKRFQRLESHVVTLARSVAHLSSEMRTQHLVMQEMDNIRAEIAALRHMYKSQQHIRSGHHRHSDPYSFSNPDRVKRLTKFFGDEPPLMRLFLKKLGYEKYAALLEKEKVGAAELPYVGEDKLRALGVPLGPRMRILKEAGVHQELHRRDDAHNTTTTLAIV